MGCTAHLAFLRPLVRCTALLTGIVAWLLGKQAGILVINPSE